MEALSEKHQGKGKIGTTLRGIGPAYADKANRVAAIRMGEFLRPDHLEKKVHRIVETKNQVFEKVFGEPGLDAAAVWREYAAYGEAVRPMIADTTAYLLNAVDAGKRILFEGAQGTLLDIDHGTYPYVTSSNASAAGAWPGTGVPSRAIGQILGVVKAYTTRVGEGPFPTELKGRPGRPDPRAGPRVRHDHGPAAPVRVARHLRHPVCRALNSIDGIVITLLDVLGGLPELKICTGYTVGGRTLAEFPDDPQALEQAQPVLETLEAVEGRRLRGPELPRPAARRPAVRQARRGGHRGAGPDHQRGAEPGADDFPPLRPAE